MTFALIADSSLTSSQSVDIPSFSTAPTVLIEGAQVNRIVYEASVDPGPTLGGSRVIEEQSQWRFQFDTNVLNDTTTSVVLTGSTMHANVFASIETLGYLYCDLPSGRVAHGTLRLSEELAQGPPRNSWIMTPSLFIGEPSALGGVSDLSSLVASMQALEVPHRSPSIMGLARRAAQAQGRTPRDVEEWARRLADDVGKLID